MMKKLILVLLAFVTVLQGCSTIIYGGKFFIETRDDGTVNSSNANRISVPEGLMISFRSSDIEFWASGGDFTNLRSSIFEEWHGYISGTNVSTTLTLGDSEGSVSFMHNQVITSKLPIPRFDTSLIS